MKELEQLQERLEEQGGATSAQIELNHKRETELTQMRKDLEAQAEEHEKAVADLRKKNTQAVGELEGQIESLQKTKSKLEKERAHLSAEMGDTSQQVEDLQKSKVRVGALFYLTWTRKLSLIPS